MSQNVHQLTAPESNNVPAQGQAAPPREEVAPSQPPPLPPQASFASRLFEFLPSLFVLALLGGVGAWGFRTDWTLPKFSALFGEPEEKPKDWCEKHDVPEAGCVLCKPDLMTGPKSYGWCEQHGVHDCPLDHPDVAQLPQTPHVTEQLRQRAEAALALTPRPKNDSACKLHPRLIQFASKEAVERAGIDIDLAAEKPVVEAVTAAGEIAYDQTLVARLSSRLPGTVWRVLKKVGQPVSRGEVVALVDAAEVGRAKTDYLQAVVQAELRTTMLARFTAIAGSLPEARLLDAKVAAQEAQLRLLNAEQILGNLGVPVHAAEMKGLAPAEVARRLQFSGLPDDLARALASETRTTNLLPVTSPLDGTVVARETVASEVVDPTKVLLVVADTRKMWLTLNVRQEDARRLTVGRKVLFQPDGGAKAPLEASITWISTAVDPKTRTVLARAELDNKDGRLRANTFGAGRVILREEKAIVVPNEAVHWDGKCHVVFVRDKNYFKPGPTKVFHVRSVRIGVKDNLNTEIIVGVLPGEVVATRNSSILRGQLLKDSLGDG